MAVIPRGARVLELEEALRFHVAWSTEDRDRVRSILEVEFPGYRRGALSLRASNLTRTGRLHSPGTCLRLVLMWRDTPSISPDIAARI